MCKKESGRNRTCSMRYVSIAIKDYRQEDLALQLQIHIQSLNHATGHSNALHDAGPRKINWLTDDTAIQYRIKLLYNESYDP